MAPVPSIAHGVEAITELINDGDLQGAALVLQVSVGNHGEDAVLPALARSLTVPVGTVLYGPGADVWRNPLRTDWAWRCGDCPQTGSLYLTERGAQEAAEKHAAEHPMPPKATAIHAR